MMRLVLSAVGFVIAVSAVAVAGGPLYVAGVSGFDAAANGKTITWRNGEVRYFTDEGRLSPVVDETRADALVAEAFARWDIPEAAVSASRGGSLGIDVTAANLGAVAATRPVAVVYDADGSVAQALLGAAARDCAASSAFALHREFAPDAHFAHALLVLNGQCVGAEDELPLFRYRLARAVGRLLGLGWSQLAEPVVNWREAPLMRPVGASCVGERAECVPWEHLHIDDAMALGQLYPASDVERRPARIRGTVRFTSWDGRPAEAMQGVNVVARLVDAVSGERSRVVAVSSVSGFRFRGDAGNPVTGFLAADGTRLDRFGGTDAALQGEFELLLPAADGTATYEISAEGIEGAYRGTLAVGPYKLSPVAPSGMTEPLRVDVTAGEEHAVELLMRHSASVPRDRFEPNSLAAPGPLPRAGSWSATLYPYGDQDAFTFTVREGRTFSIYAAALDEGSQVTAAKAQPVLGVFGAESNSLLAGAVAVNGTAQLTLDVVRGGAMKVLVTDRRGDGRADFRYRTRVLYADSVTPARLPEGGGTIEIRGMGFQRGLSVRLSNAELAIRRLTPTSIFAQVPGLAAGTYDLALRDAFGSATIARAVTVGPALSDRIAIVPALYPTVRLGGTSNVVRVRVTSAAGEPVPMAQVTFTAAPEGSLFSACGTAVCNVETDANGEAQTAVHVMSPGVVTVRAALTTGASAALDLFGTSAGVHVVAVDGTRYLLRGVAAEVPLAVKVFADSVPAAGREVRFALISGSAELAVTHVSTDATGAAASLLRLTPVSGTVQVNACVADTTACAMMNVHAVDPAATRLNVVQGGEQVVSPGAVFAPLAARVTEANGNGVSHVPVTVEATVLPARLFDGMHQRPAMAQVLGAFRLSAITDANGYATFHAAQQARSNVVVALQVRAGGNSPVALQWRILP